MGSTQPFHGFVYIIETRLELPYEWKVCRVVDDSPSIDESLIIICARLLQRGVRHGDRAKCRDQETLQTFSERDAREESLQGIQTYEAGQS